MILADQPHDLPDDLFVRFSSKNDGSVLDRSVAVHEPAIVKNRRKFCETNGVNYEEVVYQRIVYSDTASYEVVVEVGNHSTSSQVSEVVADALFTSIPGVGLFLPVADCVATVLYDPTEHFLAVLHLGRHSTLTNLLPRVVEKFVAKGSSLSNLVVWMSPSAGRASYQLEFFAKKDDPAWKPFCDEKTDGVSIDMSGFNRQRCLDLGIPRENIHVSRIDTMTDSNYFSHARGDTGGRMALLAMMR